MTTALKVVSYMVKLAGIVGAIQFNTPWGVWVYVGASVVEKIAMVIGDALDNQKLDNSYKP